MLYPCSRSSPVSFQFLQEPLSRVLSAERLSDIVSPHDLQFSPEPMLHAIEPYSLDGSTFYSKLEGQQDLQCSPGPQQCSSGGIVAQACKSQGQQRLSRCYAYQVEPNPSRKILYFVCRDHLLLPPRGITASVGQMIDTSTGAPFTVIVSPDAGKRTSCKDQVLSPH